MATPAPGAEAKSQKALEKKLRQIAEIEQKRAAGVALNEDQLAKLASKAGLSAELERLRRGDPLPDQTPASADEAPPSPAAAEDAGEDADKTAREAASGVACSGPPGSPEASSAEASTILPPAPPSALAGNRRAIEKKLRQIEELEEKQSRGMSLNEEQLVKLGGKAGLQDLLKACA
uniref:WHEP-TRS domain-containing protein n=1 Tax=Zooxanthella nutricula TaxID=1333877 RepID=A0A6U6XG88_9DINO|mmetsp:Transcript_98338/g.300698  ORF Transcript_98338/g.300698 Transcript_98338/m.300698 type:complete len:177 (+) Transcript_98338:51-581(+)|eukprot:CAMPEP_0198544228 /NCGR_PEP_ID=MMETSP1462-20131121/60166_1 /TAXON_ID=1333877 /ORGANISM="Brandtodinium nutriculum, Strain RCC3387" /LENGTH=176 /DNA_ID=CAMNT_0044274543 /DNA_START=51 /DNA_END=581 /DNA_ORIENTATION=-